MSELRFQSTYLKSMPSRKSLGRIGRIIRRATLVFAAISFLLTPVLLVALRIMPPTGLGYGLYWFHDKVYLPWKGYAVTRYFPESLIWWGVTGTLVILWLTLFVLDRSLVRQPHIAMIRHVLKQPRIFPFLLGGARWFSRIRIRPELLQAVVAQERDVILNQVVAKSLGQAGDGECERLADLTRLQIDLLLLPPVTDSVRLASALQWHEAFLAARVYANSSSAHLHKRLTLLAQHLTHCVSGSFGKGDADSATQLSEPFSLISLMVDLQRIVEIWNAPGTRQTSESEDADLRKRLAELVMSTQARRRYLMKAYTAVEQRELRIRPEGKASEEISVPVSSEDLPYVGRLTLSIALDIAVLADDPELTLGYVDAIEALSFVLALAPASQYQQLARLVTGLPRPEDYWLCAQLTSQSLRTRQEFWQLFLDQKDSPVREEDYELAAAQAAALAHAAGPAYSAAAYTVPHRRAEL